MKAGLTMVTVFGVAAALACAAVAAEKPAKHDAAKNAERTEWRGTVAAPAADAAADVVAVLTVKRHDESKTISLKVADATLAAAVKDLAGKGAMVVVKGKMAADEKSIDVTACTEAKAETKPHGERGHAKPAEAGAAK